MTRPGTTRGGPARPGGAEPRPRPAPDRSPGSYRARRRVLAAVLALLAVAGLVAGARQVLLHAARFRVATIEVTGATHTDPATVVAASGVVRGRALLAVDEADVRRRLAAVPQLAGVSVHRHWPGTLELAVTERTPVALAPSADGPVLVDATGVPYLAAPHPPPPLPTLDTARVAPDDAATRAGLDVLAALTPPLRARTRTVRAEGPSAVSLLLADGKQVRWGSADDSARKAAVAGILLTQPGRVFDVSAPELPTVRR